MKNELILNNEQIVDLFDYLDVSIAIIDKEMNMIYANRKGLDFYQKVFQAKNILGKNVKFCHKQHHIDNIAKLMSEFETKVKDFSFFGVPGVPQEVIKGGHLKVCHIPYFQNEKFVGIMEMNFESSLESGGRGEYPFHHS